MTRLSGGLIDRGRSLSFTFDGRRYSGHPGDTLASALLANGVRLMGRSFKYHRPRGPLSAGSEEPNALVELGEGDRRTPNVRATVAELHDGMVATSQNHAGSLRRDALAVNDLVSPLLTAGFYYKTFMWPKSFWEKVYEPAIRRAAGLGRLSMAPDPDIYDKGYLHCDILVVGGGAAGLAAAVRAGRSGARVILVDEDHRLGGRLLRESDPLDGAPASAWVDLVTAELADLPNVQVMTRTTVYGVYDHGIYGAVEQSPRWGSPSSDKIRETLWRITARRCVLAAGATERHVPFADNDRPGIMLAGALRAYLNRWAVAPVSRPGDPVAVFTSTDEGHRTALDLIAKGVPVAGVVDPRADAPSLSDYPLYAGAKVTGTRGRHGLSAIQVTANGKAEWLPCAALGVTGGWNPNVHLTAHHRHRPVWDDALQAFVPPADGPAGLIPAGACAGRMGSAAALADGAAAAGRALDQIGLTPAALDLPEAEDRPHRAEALWHVPGRGRAWVDFQNDVTVKDIALAHREGMSAAEHLKRWTTLGMATDQGKTSNVTALAVMAELTGRPIRETGTTMFRAPYTGVSLSTLGGGDTGGHFRPTRLTPTHAWAKSLGAAFTEVGPWLRAQYYPRDGETHWRQSVDREARAVRAAVGICDVTTLGKIDVQGADAAAFLDFVYANLMSTLKVGSVRYGLMLREDGQAYDDGTCARLGDGHYVVTTTTANAALVYRNMEFARQCLVPQMDVHLISTTDAWAQVAVAGPRSRELLSRIVDGTDLSSEALPFMGCAEITVCGGLRARIFRISFSGELAYELAVPARYGQALMERMMEVGADLGATPYGTEALGVLRIEKGHAAGAELNGQTTAAMLGLGRMVSAKKDSIGAVMSRRGALSSDTRRLVGLMPADDGARVVPGSHLFTEGEVRTLESDQGWITSACHSPHLDRSIGLGFLENGQDREGETIVAANPIEGGEVRLQVVSPHFVDPEGVRLRA